MKANITHQIPRAALTLLLMLTLALSASATDFITDVLLLGHDSQTSFNNQLSSLTGGAGWTDINSDLNAGAGGHYIHLLYKTQTSMDNTGVPITDFYIKTGEKYPAATVEHDGRTYYLVPCIGDDEFVEGQGDLNEGCGQSSDYIHLYYTKDALSSNKGVTSISFNATQSGGLGANGGSTGYDLNSGAHGDYIYMHFTTATGANVVTLSSGSGNVQLQNGHTLTGTGGSNTHVTIAAGATVTLSNVNITAIANNNSHQWAGITCLGNAVIVLNEGTTNSVKGGYRSSGIYVPENKTLTLQGSGTLNATGNVWAAGIGSDYTQSCGTISISGGTITAIGGEKAAGIGSGPGKSCGSIDITGGTITATGGLYAAGIGSGYGNSSCWHIAITGGTVTATGSTYAAGIGSGYSNSSCQDISITNRVTTVTATKGTYGTNTVGAGDGGSTCGQIVIGGRETGFITKSPFVTFPYTIAFDINDGTGILGNMTVMYDIATNLPPNDYTLSGYIFYGWATSANGPMVYGDEASVINLTETPNDTVTLYAKWRTHLVTLTPEIIGNVKLYNGDTLTGTGGPDIRVTIDNWATVTFSGVNITAILEDDDHKWPGITCLGNAVIVLAEGTTNSVKGGGRNSGIYVPENHTLTLQGSGTLNATGGRDNRGCAGIGSGFQQTCGNITIGGGTVTATGGQNGAGIGSGVTGSCGNITISGGTVTATGYGSAAGIGSGFNNAQCANITISGGTVTASGGQNGAGIGSGRDSSCGNITISGGTVTASGGDIAAGIGSGFNNAQCANITISGGTVTASGGPNAAGIGSGYDHSSCGDITITNGVTLVTATAGQDCNNAIGAGNDGSCGTVTIGGVETGFITQSPFVTYPYTVSFDANGGTGTMANQVFMHKVAQSLAANSFTLLGAEFEGWATTPDGPKVYNDGQSVNNLTQTSGDTVTLYAKWITHLSVDGNEYTIHTATGWDLFCEMVQSDGFFTGKTVKLADDITVTSMAGSWNSDSNYHAFTGTFDGQGHTLTLNYSSNETHCAPFRVIDGATIQNLHLAGSIQTSGKFAGVAGHAYGICNLTNCRSTITISSTVNGDGTHGGFVGVIGSGTTTFTGCVFDGTFTSTVTTNWGGFVGFVEGNNQAHATFTDCLFAPANSSFGFSTNGSQTFARLRNNNLDFATFSNSYYTQVLGGAQGIQATTHEAISAAGQATTYDVSGISAYVNGMQYGTAFYYNPDRNFLRTVAGYGTGSGGWQLIASPLQGSTSVSDVTNLITTNSEYDLYYFDQTGGDNGKEWKNYKAHHNDATNPFNALVSGKGYLYANSATVSLVFSGAPYSGTGEVSVTYTDNAELAGWNLIGNPFGEAAYLVDANNQGLAYYKMNNDGNGFDAVSNNAPIAAMEGIFYQAEASGSVYFSTTAPASKGGHLNMTVSQGRGTKDNAIIRFGEGNTMEQFSFREGSTKVYIPQNGKEYAIINVSAGTDVARDVARYVSTEIPVNFKAEENGTYTLTFSSENVDFDYLHLIDNLTGADVDLLATNGGDAMNRVSTYTFEAKTTDYESRFKLVFNTNNEDGPSTGSGAFAFIDASGNIIITDVADTCDVSLQVVDMMGRVLVCKDAPRASTISTSGMTAGVYVLRLIQGEKVRTQKIVIE